MRLLWICALIGFVSAVEECQMSDWSAWGECLVNKRCLSEQERRLKLMTFPVEETDKWDSGRSAMHQMMLEKLRQFEERAACRADGSCPHLADRPSSGYTACVGGMADDIPCSNVDQHYFMNFVDMGYDKTNVPSDGTTAGNDIWGWTDPQNGDEYAIMGLTGGTTFVRITDPQNPVPAGVVYTQTVASSWRDIKVVNNHAFIVSEARDHGLQVFDLTRLRGSNTAQEFQPDAHYDGFGNAHNIVSNEDTEFVYVVGATQSGYPLACSGLLTLDVSDPVNPAYQGCYSGDGYVHDAQCVVYHGPDTTYQGREICFCYNEDTFTIVDVDDKSNMHMISKTGYANAAYTHQGWLTEDHTVALMDDEQDEVSEPIGDRNTKTYVWNVETLTNPQLVSIFEAAHQSIDHNQYMVGDLTFQANYESGLRILNFDSATDELSEVAYFDVRPDRTAAGFSGSWSVYPYYPSGNVVVSSIDYGLFVLQPDYNAIGQLVKSKKAYGERARTRRVLHRAPGAQCPAVRQTQSCDADLTC